MYRKFSPGSAAALLLLAAITAPAPRARAAAGDMDSLNARVLDDVDQGFVLATAVQPDGKIIIAGNFDSVHGVARANLARLNADGTLDMGFNPGSSLASGVAGTVHSLAVQADGKILLGGAFSLVGGITRQNIARLNADGTVDTGFNPRASDVVKCVAVQVDGKVLLGGDFQTLWPPGGTLVARNRVARVNADGTVDTGFNPGAGGSVHCLAVQADGKVLLGGRFGLGRLNANGTGDTGFNAGSILVTSPASVSVDCVAVQADGKVLLGGDFTSVGGATRNRIARVNTDGTLDTGFDPNAGNGYPSCPFFSVTVQTDGKVLLGGAFNQLKPNGAASPTTRDGVARLNANGTLDTGFDPNPTIGGALFACVGGQADGKVLLGGSFSQVQPNGGDLAYIRYCFARLLNDPATQTLSAPSASQVLWIRSGAAPEVGPVTFELSTDGGANWSLLPGTATRIGTTPNWQLTGLSLAGSGQIRARGRTAGAYHNASSGIIEQVITFTIGPEIAVTGNGVDIADGDTTPDVADHTHFAWAVPGATTVVRTFTITNPGIAALNLTGTPRVAVSGANAAEFAVTLQPATPVAATTGTTTFQITFNPTAVGPRTATVSIACNDADETTFDFAIRGRGLSYTTDTDGDGLNDAAEFLGAALGFDWQVSQPALVQTYNGMANGAGLYTTAQVQALHMDVPLLQRNPGTNTFTFTFGLRKSTTLAPGSFVPFPFTPAGTSVNGAGKVQYQFTSPDNAAFFRLEMP